MQLTTKFNLVLTGVLTFSMAGTALLSYSILQKNARDEVVQHAGMMMEAALAIRSYTVSEIRPLLKPQMKHSFLPQSVPAYAASQTFKLLGIDNPDYHYKEATLNPTNPGNKAVDWERDIIQQFRGDPGKRELTGIQQTAEGQSLYLARPIRIGSAGCLSCHSTPQVAPASMTAVYGKSNGFGWKIKEIVGIQIISVPMAIPIKQAQQVFIAFMAVVIGIFALTMVVLNIMLRRIVIRPVVRMATIADQISLGKTDALEFRETGKDELSLLGASFNRLRRSLEKAISMLDD